MVTFKRRPSLSVPPRRGAPAGETRDDADEPEGFGGITPTASNRLTLTGSGQADTVRRFFPGFRAARATIRRETVV
jgi:hypothetical protein